MRNLGTAKDYTTNELATGLAGYINATTFRSNLDDLLATEAAIELAGRVAEAEKAIMEAEGKLALERRNYQEALNKLSEEAKVDREKMKESRLDNMIYGIASKDEEFFVWVVNLLLLKNRKIDAIKFCGYARGLSLEASRDLVDGLAARIDRGYLTSELARAAGISEQGASALAHILKKSAKINILPRTKTDVSALRSALLNVTGIQSDHIGKDLVDELRLLYVMEQLGLLDESLDTLSSYTVRTIAVIVLTQSGYPDYADALKLSYSLVLTACSAQAIAFAHSENHELKLIVKNIVEKG